MKYNTDNESLAFFFFEEKRAAAAACVGLVGRVFGMVSLTELVVLLWLLVEVNSAVLCEGGAF